MATPQPKKNGVNFGYTAYVFRKDEQDPIIDKIRTIFADYGETQNRVATQAGISPATLNNWFNGKTKRPQFATTAAVVRTMGFDFVLAPMEKNSSVDAKTVGTILKRFPTAGQQR